MIMNLENYYESHIKGKNKEEILNEIQKLKQRINHLKNNLEAQREEVDVVEKANKIMQIDCERKYLEYAKQTYIELGGTYLLSPSEKKVEKFKKNFDHIKKVKLDIGGYFDGHHYYTVELLDDLKAYTEFLGYGEPLALVENYRDMGTKEAFMAELKALHIGEWLSEYSTERFGYFVCDGTQWGLEIEYNNHQKPITIYGSNAYPYNFESLLKLFRINEEDEIN